ncbi:MAG: hypothetical protein RIT02_680, partial [Planctomycetota bacterium]
ALQHNELEVTHCSHSIRPAVRQTTSGAPAIRTITRGGDVAGPLRPPRERARLLPSRQTPGRRNEERGGGGNPFFRVVSVLRGPLFVNTCDYAIGSDLHNFELVRNFQYQPRSRCPMKSTESPHA